jgi:hypothetical protein
MSKKQSFYFYHIRKTAGRAIIHCFLQAAFRTTERDSGGSHYFYVPLCRKKRLKIDDKVLVAHSLRHIQEEVFWFAFSHNPYWRIGEFESPHITFTCIREPLERFLSYYRGLKKEYKRFSRTEAKHIHLPFKEFVDKIEKKHLLTTVWMFSKTFNVNEAFERITKLDVVMFQDKLEKYMKIFKLAHFLEPIGVNSKYPTIDLPESDINYLEQKLKPEIELYKHLKNWEQNNLVK